MKDIELMRVWNESDLRKAVSKSVQTENSQPDGKKESSKKKIMRDLQWLSVFV
jgi:hypothetical protein